MGKFMPSMLVIEMGGRRMNEDQADELIDILNEIKKILQSLSMK